MCIEWSKCYYHLSNSVTLICIVRTNYRILQLFSSCIVYCGGIDNACLVFLNAEGCENL